MRFKLGLVLGAAVGYYAGSKAGRQRYDQINRAVRRLRRSEVIESAATKARSTLEEGVSKARDRVGAKVGGSSGSKIGGGAGGNGHGSY